MPNSLSPLTSDRPGLPPQHGSFKNRKYPIYWKNLGQGDVAWSTCKTVLVWDLNNIAQLLPLPPSQQEKVEAALAAIPRTTHTISLRKWRKLLGLMYSITLAVAGSRSIFI